MSKYFSNTLHTLFQNSEEKIPHQSNNKNRNKKIFKFPKVFIVYKIKIFIYTFFLLFLIFTNIQNTHQNSTSHSTQIKIQQKNKLNNKIKNYLNSTILKFINLNFGFYLYFFLLQSLYFNQLIQ